MPRVLLGLLVGLGLLAALAAAAALWMTRMPGRSHGPDLPPLTPEEAALRDRLTEHVRILAGEIGERNAGRPEGLHRAREYLRRALEERGYAVVEDAYPVGGVEVANLEAVHPGPADECIVVGAHYDSAPGTPGANDNASGVAVLLELASLWRETRKSQAHLRGRPFREVRFVCFTNEEQPFFGTEAMGSLRYARGLRAKDVAVTAMLSLETLGYYTDEPKSQHYPWLLAPLYPATGNFIAFVGNMSSRGLVRRVIRAFRTQATLPSAGGAVPGGLPGIGWSDHWAFWETGYPAILVTDTAFYRYPMYHQPGDVPGAVDAARLARLTRGLLPVLEALAGTGP